MVHMSCKNNNKRVIWYEKNKDQLQLGPKTKRIAKFQKNGLYLRENNLAITTDKVAQAADNKDQYNLTVCPFDGM